MKKIISSLFFLSFAFLVTLSFSSNANAEELEKVKLKNVFVEIPYDQSEFEFLKTESQNSVKVDVVDKETGKVLETYGEIVEPTVKAFKENATMAATSSYSVSTVYRQRTDGPAVSRLSTQLNIYSSGSFRQIQGILNTWWSEATGGSWYLTREVASAVSMTGSFPTTKVQVSGSATIEVKTSHSISGEFSISALQSAGYSYGYTSGSEVFYRKPISLGFQYSLY